MIVYLQMIESPAEKSKFEILYREYRSLMYHIAYKYLGHPEDAEDAVHHAFVKIAENISKISDPESPKTKQFIVTIIEHRSIDMLRRRKRRAQIPFDESWVCPADLPEPEDRLARCILRLSKEQQQVIWLKYHFGYDLREIAKMLDISLSWAQKIDQRAKKKLEQLLQEEGVIL